MKRLTSPPSLTVLAILLLLAALVPSVHEQFVVLAVGSGTVHSIRTTGLPCPEEMLQWTEWEAGAGPTVPSHIVDRIDPDAVIVARRAGTDLKGFVELTFYQGKYQNPDGWIVIQHADGPKPLLGLHTRRTRAWRAACCGLSAACFAVLMIRWWREPVRESKPESGLSAEEVIAYFPSEHPAPDDATVRQWSDEHRMEKYGGSARK
jgi:hypothetical protein